MGQKNSFKKSNENDQSSSTTASETFANGSQDIKSPAVSANYRDIILGCFDKASCITASRILMRIHQQRPDFRTYKDNLTSEQNDSLINLLSDYLRAVIENIDDVNKVKELSMNYGSKHVNLRLNGFKPDFFAPLAGAIAIECSFLSDAATTHAPINTFKAWTILVDLMFSSVRDGYYQELRRQRQHHSCSPTHLKSSCKSSANTKRLLGNSDSNLTDSNFRFENNYYTTNDQRITTYSTSAPKQFLSTIDSAKRDIANHRISRLVENISIQEATTSTTISRPLLQKSNSISNFLKSLSAAPSRSADDNYQCLRTKRRKHIKRSRLTIPNPTIGRFFKHLDASANYEVDKQSLKQSLPQSSLPKPFDPNKIMEDFMNDQYKV